MNVIALTQGVYEPSARFRIRALRGPLHDIGVKLDESVAEFGAYPPPGILNRLIWAPKAMFDGIRRAQHSAEYDACFLQRPLVSTLISGEPFIKVPYVFDVDDAIFLSPRQWSVDYIARRASKVVCGNQYLADYFSSLSDVVVIPTGVDVDRFVTKQHDLKKDSFVVGWSGTSGNFKYLYQIEKALQAVLDISDSIVLKIVSNSAPDFKSLNKNKVIFKKWSAEDEVIDIHSFDVGLMPLLDDPWARGKCSFKMLTYMSCGIPVVVSPVGMNNDLLKKGNIGFSAASMDDWVDAIRCLFENKPLAQEMGRVGRDVVCTGYSTQVVATMLAATLRSIR